MSNGAIYEFWGHGQSGAVFAVRLNGEGRLTGCHGPLLSLQMLSVDKKTYPYDDDPEDLAWIERHRDNWSPFEY